MLLEGKLGCWGAPFIHFHGNHTAGAKEANQRAWLPEVFHPTFTPYEGALHLIPNRMQKRNSDILRELIRQVLPQGP